MKNKKIPPDNTGKKYLTELTSKQRKFIDLYCSKFGEWSGTHVAIAAGYEKSSAHTRASELLDWRKYPQVVKEIDKRLADFRDLWSIDKEKSMAALFKIKEKAGKSLTDIQIKALDAFDRELLHPDNLLVSDYIKGGIYFLNNYHTIHGRSLFEDHPGDVKRELLRVWTGPF